MKKFWILIYVLACKKAFPKPKAKHVGKISFQPGAHLGKIEFSKWSNRGEYELQLYYPGRSASHSYFHYDSVEQAFADYSLALEYQQGQTIPFPNNNYPVPF